ncbi:MAG: PP2C family protein-serine/threonine phosphatase [Bacteroidota bacterium]
MPQHNERKYSFFNTLQNDLQRTKAYNKFRKESKEVADFYLTDEQRERLKNMGRFKRSLFQSGWIFRAMFQKLTPMRQLMFVAGIIFLVRVRASVGDENYLTLDFNALFGGGLLVLVILLELKEKLLAHDELEAGRKIQESLMPQRVPVVEGWKLWLYTRSANEVCGDLIDHMTLEEGRFNIVMADVAGKGLHAALITAKLQATIRALAGEIRTLPELIGKINAIVHRDSPSHIFSSLFYAECSEANGAVRFVNAGHFPALVVRGNDIEETAKGDAALGLARTMHFTEHHAELNIGDRLILFSDGLTEAKNEAGEFFGKERLTAVIASSSGSPEQTGFAVLQKVDAFIGTSTPSDDLSLIILQKV